MAKRKIPLVNELTEKTALHSDDLLILEDSQDSYSKKKVKAININGKLKTYPGTVSNVGSTTAETTCLSFSVPAADIGDGDVIYIRYVYKAKNSTGSTQNFSLNFYYGTDSITLENAYEVENDAAEATNDEFIVVMRAGTDLYVNGLRAGSSGFGSESPFANMYSEEWNAGVISNPGFATAKNIEIKATLGTSSADFYYNPLGSNIYKIQA